MTQMKRLNGRGTITILPTCNTEWGFYGSVRSDHDEATTNRKWNRVFRAIAEEFKAESMDVQTFLDSKWGRHLADGLTMHTLHWMFANWRRWFESELAACKADRLITAA